MLCTYFDVIDVSGSEQQMGTLCCDTQEIPILKECTVDIYVQLLKLFTRTSKSVDPCAILLGKMRTSIET